MGRKALNVKDTVLPELSGCPSPLEGKCAQTSPRSKMAVFWSTWFSDHTGQADTAGLGSGSQTESRIWGVVPVPLSAPAPWEGPCSPRSPSDPLCPLRLCTPGWLCINLVWWMLTWPGLPGAIMGDPTHDKVMKKIPDMQGHSGSHPWRGHEEKTWHARTQGTQGTLQVDPGLYPTLYPPPFSAVVLVCPAADSCVVCWEFSCSSFTE